MCLDKLHIKFPSLGDRSVSTDIQTQGVSMAPYRPDNREAAHIDYHDLTAALDAAGFEAEEGRIRGQRRLKYNIRGTDGRPKAAEIWGQPYNDNYMRVTEIHCNPRRLGGYGRLMDLLGILQTVSSTDILRTGQIGRIDYACDYRVAFPTLMQGLFYEYARTVIAYADVTSLPFAERTSADGLFTSYRIGAGTKAIKVYDKSRQMRNLLRREDPSADETDLQSRIEIALTAPAAIRRIWARPAVLSELGNHLRDIAQGVLSPFQYLLLNDVVYRSSRERGFRFIDNHHNLRLRFGMEDGKLNEFYRDMTARNLNFWHETENAFALYPWERRYQPAETYRRRLGQWAFGSDSYDPLGETLPPVPASPHRLTRWPLELTVPISIRLRSSANNRRSPLESLRFNQHQAPLAS